MKITCPTKYFVWLVTSVDTCLSADCFVLLQVGKSKVKSERMDVILKGILSSNHADTIKRDLLLKIAEKGAASQPESSVLAVLELTTRWVLEGDSDLQHNYGLEIYKSWGRHNLVTFEQFFNKDHVLNLMSKKVRNRGSVGVLLAESMRLLQMTSMFRIHCTVIEAKAVSYVKEHPYIDCLTNFAEFLLEFKECVPKGEALLHFCTNLILSLSLCSPPEAESDLVTYIKSANTVASLIYQIWKNSDSQIVLGCLKEIFRIISSPCDVEPAVCLGSLVQYIPVDMINTVVKNVISDSSIDNNSMVTAIQRIIDWLQWPTARFVDHWVIAFLKGLASIQKYSILITVTENKADQVGHRVLQLSGSLKRKHIVPASSVFLSVRHILVQKIT